MGALEIIDGAATGLGAVTGLWDSAEQTRANNANIAMQRETNQLNYKMHKEDQDFAVDMFNRTNEYNSPAEQVNRLRAAGINPSAVLGNSGSSGVVAANQPSVPAGAPMVAPRSEPAQFSPAFKMLTDGIYEHMQTRNMDLQNKQELFKILHQDQQWELDATYRLAEIDEKLAGSDLKDEERKNLKKQREVIQQELDIKREVKDDIIKRYRLDNQKVEQDTAFIREQENKQKLENAYQEMVNKAFPKLNAAQLRVLASQAAANTATAFAQTQQGHFSKAQKELTAIKSIGETLLNGIKSNQFKASQIDLDEKELQAFVNQLHKGYEIDALKRSPIYHKISTWLGQGATNIFPILGAFSYFK